MEPLRVAYANLPLALSIPLTLVFISLVSVVQNVIRQVYFADPHRPPVVFHLVPWVGSTVRYGMDPYKFFFECQAKHGDCFTFILLGKPTTVFLGPRGNNFIFNGKHSDLNAEGIYQKATTPVFGRGVIYDCPNERLMDQKRLLKEGFTTNAMRAYVPSFVKEVEGYIRTSHHFRGQSGECNITDAMAEITLYTASGSLQGKEVRSRFDNTFAVLYRHLDEGFRPINFVAPWLPLPQNRRRDKAQKIMEDLYSDIIRRRREEGKRGDETDMIWALMDAEYKDGTIVPDAHIARLMIALLMGGQHSSATTGAWIMLELANRPELIEELYQEQLRVLGSPLPPLTWENLQKLTLNAQVIKETLRLHNPAHSLMRQVTSPIPVPESDWVVPPRHTLLASPSTSARSEQFFHRPLEWDPRRWDAGAQILKADDDQPTVNYGFGMVSKATNSPYLPFGAGRHRCVGEQFAYTQMGTIIATIVRLLQWEQIDPKAPVPPTDYSSMFSKPIEPARIRWHLRD
ncbi:cytochrome P450 [Thozetella sp. PMI_491]|nr:cytochrome P450 [Thozetella sp. PMI_491]